MESAGEKCKPLSYIASSPGSLVATKSSSGQELCLFAGLLSVFPWVFTPSKMFRCLDYGTWVRFNSKLTL